MVTIVGRKNSGKTTLTVKLVRELTARGHRTMTIKHGTHTFNIDPESTDTWKHYNEGGAERVAMASPDKFALVLRWNEERSPQDIAQEYMSDADVVVCEGFKLSSLPKIEIFRRAANDEPLYGRGFAPDSDYVAVVTDDPNFSANTAVLLLDNPDLIPSLAELVEREIMGR